MIKIFSYIAYFIIVVVQLLDNCTISLYTGNQKYLIKVHAINFLVKSLLKPKQEFLHFPLVQMIIIFPLDKGRMYLKNYGKSFQYNNLLNI